VLLSAKGLGSNCEVGQQSAGLVDFYRFVILILPPYSLPYSAEPHFLLGFLTLKFKEFKTFQQGLAYRGLVARVVA
jgi:hypothetical protein